MHCTHIPGGLLYYMHRLDWMNGKNMTCYLITHEIRPTLLLPRVQKDDRFEAIILYFKRRTIGKKSIKKTRTENIIFRFSQY